MSMKFLQVPIIDTTAIKKAVEENDSLDRIFNITWEDVINHIPALITGLLVLVIFYLLANVIERTFIKFLRQRTSNKNALVANFFGKVLWFLTFGVGLTMSLSIWGLGNLGSGILGLAGIGTVVAGFALRDIFENFLSGIIISFNPPFELGSMIEVNGIRGQVQEMSLRETIIKSPTGSLIYVPNSMLIKNPLSNHTREGKLRRNFVVYLSQKAPITKATRISKEVLHTVPGVLNETGFETAVFVSTVERGSLEMTCAYWIDINDPQTNVVAISNHAIDAVMTRLQAEEGYLPTGVNVVDIQ